MADTTTQDFKVADLSLAEFGRKEIRLAEQLDCELLTADRRLARAPGIGVRVTVV